VLLTRTAAALTGVLAASALMTAPAGAVVGGTPVDAVTAPWLAAVGSPAFFVRASGQFCGGTLIAPDKLVTAAHCVSYFRLTPSLLSATFGRSDLVAKDGVTVGVRQVWVHPGFHETTFRGETVEHNDVAVLTLAQKPNRPVLKIATSDVYRNPTAQILGWGTTSDSDIFNTRLRTATVPLVPDATCAAAYGSSFDKGSMVCAGSPKADTCLFDSGGPLIVNGRLAGLTSWAYGCARTGFPGVYTRLPALAGSLP
jgi:secreted trypsin-like serine protease